MLLRGASIGTITSVEAAPLPISPEGTDPMVCDYCNISTVTPITTIRPTAGDMARPMSCHKPITTTPRPDVYNQVINHSSILSSNI